MPQTSPPAADLSQARDAIFHGRDTASHAVQRSLDAARHSDCDHAFLTLFEARAVAEAAATDSRFKAGAPLPPLAGLAVSVKALFDVAGHVTTAASRSMRGQAPATSDATAVQRLSAAGAALIGHTNMSEFAFSGVGINPHHGTPANVTTRRLDGVARAPGGSSSGGAVSVASGAAWAALGSDTGGSIRIPAALHGLVGFKNTARLTPTDGAIPLSTTLDTACAITRSVRDATLLHRVLSAHGNPTEPVRRRPLARLRLGLPQTLMLDGLEPAVATAFTRSLQRLREAGAVIEELVLPELGEVASINAGGGFSPVEAWAWHRRRLDQHEPDYDPRVVTRIRRGAAMSGADYLDLVAARRQWMDQMHRTTHDFDALLSPTVPMTAPALAELIADDQAFFATNARLLRNPSVVNLLDGCALSLPCHEPGELPVGLMVWHGALRDDDVLEAGAAIESTLAAATRSLA